MTTTLDSIREIISQNIPANYFQTEDNMLDQVRKHDYSDGDQALILEDLKAILARTFEGKTERDHFIVTAGGPGSGKTTLIENWLQSNPQIAYVDPDDSCLVHMKGFQSDLPKERRPGEAHDKWQYASTMIAWICLAKAMKEHRSVAFGSTLSHPLSVRLLSAATTAFTNLTLMHVSATEELRQKSGEVRNQTFHKVTPAIITDKGRAACERLPDFLATSFRIDFYVRDTFNTIRLVAIREQGTKSVVVKDRAGFELMRKVHEAASVEFDKCFADHAIAYLGDE